MNDNVLFSMALVEMKVPLKLSKKSFVDSRYLSLIDQQNKKVQHARMLVKMQLLISFVHCSKELSLDNLRKAINVAFCKG